MKVIKSKIVSIILLACLTSCSLNEIEIRSDSEVNEISEDVFSYGSSETESGSVNNEENDEADSTFSLAEINEKIKIDSDNILSGSLYLTITDAKIYKNFNSSGLSQSKLHFDYKGERASDIPFVYLHIILENEDAKSKESTLFHDYDDYMFRIDSLLYVLDTEHISDEPYDKTYRYGCTSYFSGYDSLPVHSFAFELQPGEKKEFDVGIFPYAGLFNNLNTSWETYNLDKIYASVSGFKPDCSLINLHLNEWE